MVSLLGVISVVGLLPRFVVLRASRLHASPLPLVVALPRRPSVVPLRKVRCPRCAMLHVCHPGDGMFELCRDVSETMQPPSM